MPPGRSQSQAAKERMRRKRKREKEEYEVLHVIGKRINGNGKVEYHLMWVDYPKEDATWQEAGENGENLAHCQALVDAYEERRKYGQWIVFDDDFEALSTEQKDAIKEVYQTIGADPDNARLIMDLLRKHEEGKGVEKEVERKSEGSQTDERRINNHASTSDVPIPHELEDQSDEAQLHSDAPIPRELEDQSDDQEQLTESLDLPVGSIAIPPMRREVVPIEDSSVEAFTQMSVSILNVENKGTNHPLGTQHLFITTQSARDIENHFNALRMDWTDFIIETKELIPAIKDGKIHKPTEQSKKLRRSVVDLFRTFYHELKDQAEGSLLADINASDAIEMYESETEAKNPRRPPLDLLIKMLHQFACKNLADDMNVPFRVCSALEKVVPIVLPYSASRRHHWLIVFAGGMKDIAVRKSKVIDELTGRCRKFFENALFHGEFHRAVVKFVVFYCEVDLLCAMTPVIERDEERKGDEEEPDKVKKKKKEKEKHPLAKFPLILLLIMDFYDQPKRGLSATAIQTIEKLMELVVSTKRSVDFSYSSTLNRALLCLLEAARWHCAMSDRSDLTPTDRANERNNRTGVTIELRQNVERIIEESMEKGLKRDDIREMLSIGWLEDIVK